MYMPSLEILLEGTGLQFIDPGSVTLDQEALDHEEFFFRPTNHSEIKPPGQFSPFLITPDPVNSKNSEYLDIHGNPIEQNRVFQVKARDSLWEYKDKWLPIPYTGKVLGPNETAEVDCNNWVRLWYQMPQETGNNVHFVLCVDTAATSTVNRGFIRQVRTWSNVAHIFLA
jgi:hypothetical protein